MVSKKINKSKKIEFFKPKSMKSNSQKSNSLKLKIPSYLTSHTKPQNVRKYIAGKERLNCMDNKPFQAWGKPKSMNKKDMTWPQAKVRFPKLKPMVDTDRDGVINLLDCKPFNKRKQGLLHKKYKWEKTKFPVGTLAQFRQDVKEMNIKDLERFKKYSEEYPQFLDSKGRKDISVIKKELIKRDKSEEEFIERLEYEKEYPKEKKELWDKADEGTLTPDDITKHETEKFNEDYNSKEQPNYDLNDEDDITLDYDEEQEDILKNGK